MQGGMNKNTFIWALLLFSSSSFSAEWESVYSTSDSASEVADSIVERVNGKTVTYWEVSPDKISGLCNKAKENAQETYKSVLPTFQPIYPDSEWRLTYQGECTVKNNLGRQSDIYVSSASIDFSIERSLPDSDGDNNSGQTPEDICKAKPSIDDTFNNVGNGYINYNGCEYEATGIIVCRNDKTVCAATWKPTGYVSKSDDTESQPVSGDSDSGSDESGSHSGGSKSNLSKDDIASAVQTGVKSAAPTVASEIKDSLTEKDTSESDQQKADKKTQINISSLEAALNDGVRGAGKFADPDGSSIQYGEGSSELDLSISLTKNQLGIEKDSHGASWDAFIDEGALRPNIPTGNGCVDFLIFSGTVYEVSIGCDKLSDIKSMLSWAMYCLTFWYVFSSITSLLRKGDN
jgi:hypothetical protein